MRNVALVVSAFLLLGACVEADVESVRERDLEGAYEALRTNIAAIHRRDVEGYLAQDALIRLRATAHAKRVRSPLKQRGDKIYPDREMLDDLRDRPLPGRSAMPISICQAVQRLEYHGFEALELACGLHTTNLHRLSPC